MSIALYILDKEDVLTSAEKIGGERLKNWVTVRSLHKKDSGHLVCPDEQGHIAYVLKTVSDVQDMYAIANVAKTLPQGKYHVDYSHHKKANMLTEEIKTMHQLGWMLGQYDYDAYFSKPKTRAYPELVISKEALDTVTIARDAIFKVRDLINMPPCDMYPETLVNEVKTLGDAHGATVNIIKGEALKKGYPMVYAVGKASDFKPHYAQLAWGNPKHPKVTLVGKGVCFDTGGLDIKAAANMKLMKKDMGGAAAVLGLAHMVMAHNMPISLRVLIPAVENSISGNAFRTSDVLKARNGTTVEIGNTDAEGRLILSDALTDACEQSPELIIDCATLTGAARVALGTDLPACFANNRIEATKLLAIAGKTQDALWELPLHKPYASMLKSSIADINHTASGGYGGAITAALYLQTFITVPCDWFHIDMMAWNLTGKAGRPKGGEAMGIRALFAYLQQRYT
jgi:leucyl aminopeptidase